MHLRELPDVSSLSHPLQHNKRSGAISREDTVTGGDGFDIDYGGFSRWRERSSRGGGADVRATIRCSHWRR